METGTQRNLLIFIIFVANLLDILLVPFGIFLFRISELISKGSFDSIFHFKKSLSMFLTINGYVNIH